MVLRMTRRRQWKRLCLGRTSLYRFQRRFLRFPRVVRTSSACHDDSSGNGKSLFVCKKPCFAKLDQGMSKVSAVENIIRELHGPVDAMLSFCGTAEPEEGATASVVYANANACTQTEPVSEESSGQADEVRMTLGKKAQEATLETI